MQSYTSIIPIRVHYCANNAPILLEIEVNYSWGLLRPVFIFLRLLYLCCPSNRAIFIHPPTACELASNRISMLCLVFVVMHLLAPPTFLVA